MLRPHAFHRLMLPEEHLDAPSVLFMKIYLISLFFFLARFKGIFMFNSQYFLYNSLLQ